MAYSGKKPGSPKTGGRIKGTPNKSTQALYERAEALGVDPFEILLYFAKGDERSLGYNSEQYRETEYGKVVVVRITPEMRIRAAAEACQYLYPKRKAIEISGNEGGPLDVFLQMTPEQRAQNMEQLEKRLGRKKEAA